MCNITETRNVAAELMLHIYAVKVRGYVWVVMQLMSNYNSSICPSSALALRNDFFHISFVASSINEEHSQCT